MSEKLPIFDPMFWKQRLALSDGEPHRAIRYCSIDQRAIYDDLARKIIAGFIRKNDAILDVGCACGLLLDIMPKSWVGDYVGIDLSPDFISIARSNYPHRTFVEHDIRSIPMIGNKDFDWAIAFDLKKMVLKNSPADWPLIEKELNRVADRILILEPTIMTDDGRWDVTYEVC